MDEPRGRSEVSGEGLAAVGDGPAEADASAGGGDDGRAMSLPLGAFPLWERFAFRIGQRGGGRRAEDPSGRLVAAGGAADHAGFSRLPQDRRETGRRGRRKAPDVADPGDTLCRAHRPHSRQRLDEGAVRPGGAQGGRVAAVAEDLHPNGERPGGRPAHLRGSPRRNPFPPQSAWRSSLVAPDPHGPSRRHRLAKPSGAPCNRRSVRGGDAGGPAPRPAPTAGRAAIPASPGPDSFPPAWAH